MLEKLRSLSSFRIEARHHFGAIDYQKNVLISKVTDLGFTKNRDRQLIRGDTNIIWEKKF
jgi:hypothetical protein